MNPPNQKTATIGEMVTWASQANGTIKRGAKYHLINAILMDIENLQALASVPWVSRKWALPAWCEIKRIGITDGLELMPPLSVNFSIARIRQLCGLLGLHFNKVNDRIVITRQPITKKTPEPKTYTDMTPSERSASSPEFGMEIDPTAKLTQFT